MRFFGRLTGRSRPEPELCVDDTPGLFEQRLAASGLSVPRLDAPCAVDQVLAFYRDVRVARAPLEADGDMLLFQWGVYDWGQGPSFQFDLTRQFISDDEGIRQLSLVLHFAPSETLSAIAAGNHWCPSLTELPAFESFVRSSEAYLAVGHAAPERVELELQSV